MADLDAFVTIASNNGDTFNISSNNDLLIFTDSLQQNILIGTDKTYYPHMLLSSSTVEIYKNITVQGDLNLTGTLTQAGSTLGSKWGALWNTVYLLDSNVSIGTTKSNSLLNIHDSNTISPSNARITFTTDELQDGYAQVGLSNTGDFLVWHTSNYNIRMGTSDAERFTITSNGAVGISNSSPAYTLDVGGDINITGYIYKNGQFYNSGPWSNDNNTVFVTQSNVAIGLTDANSLLHLHNPIADNSLITFTNSITQSNQGVLCGLDSNGDGLLWHQKTFDIRLGTDNNEVMRLTSMGKVGINTAIPAYQLDVYGAMGAIEANISSNLNTSNIFVEGILSSSNIANFDSNAYFNGSTFMKGVVEMSNNLIVRQIFTNCNAIQAEGSLTVKGTTTLSNKNTLYDVSYIQSNLIFVNTGSTYIASKTGNLGIKTENPLFNLDVNGSISALGYCNLLVDSYTNSSTNRAPTANALLQLYNLLGSGATDATFASNAVVPTSNTVFNTWTGYSTTSFYTLKSNVGIGTSTPATNLELSDTSSSNVYIQFKNSTHSGKIGMSSNLLVINNNFIQPIIFGNNGTEYMRLSQNGYLGINKSNPTYPLDIIGDVNFTGTLYKNGTAFQTSRWLSNSDGVYIQSNIGIKTFPSTTYELDVNGDVNFSGILYQNGNPFQTSRWTSNADGIYIMSNIGLNKLPNSTYELDVNGDINFSGGLYKSGSLFQTSRWTSNADGIYILSNIGLNKLPDSAYELDVNGDINFSGILYQHGNPFQTSRWTSNADGIYVLSNIGLNKLPSSTYELDVNGDINFSGGLYQGGSLFQTSRWSSNSANGIFVMSNVGIKTNPSATNALVVNGDSLFNGHILPSNDSQYDLGSATRRFRDLWLSSNSLRLGDVVVSSSASNGVNYLNLPAGLKISSNIEIANSVAIRGLKILKRDGTMANITTTSIRGLSNDDTGIIIMMPSNASTNSMRFVANGNELMRLTGSGNLGIGTTNPTSKFEVNGTVNATTINATTLQQGGTGVLTTAGGTLTGTLTGTTINATTAVQTNGTTRIDSTGILQNILNFVGIVLPYAGLTEPSGWVFCYGQAVSRTGTYANLFSVLVSGPQTFTVTVASPAVFTTSIAHNLSAGEIIYLTTTGALPTGLTAITTPYYVLSTGLTITSFRLSTTNEGAAINTSGTQSGTHSLWRAPHGIGDGSTTFNLPDMRGRVAVGRDNMGGTTASRVTSAISGLAGASLGAGGGDQRLQAHAHNVGIWNTSADGPNYNPTVKFQGQQYTDIPTAVAGGGNSQNIQPSIVLNYIIKF